MRAFRRQEGQALVLSTLLLVGLLGITALVVDVGSWFRAQRDTQAIADAAALAGAQELPESTAAATARAIEYTTKNGGSSPQITFGTTGNGTIPNTIYVEVRKDAPGFFSKMFGINWVNVGAKAAARASSVGAARWVAPIVVHESHPMLLCKPPPCSEPTTIELQHLHKPGSGNASGSFGLISLNDDQIDANTLAVWLLEGFNDFMKAGHDYRSAPSANFNNGQFQQALRDRMNTELLFPVYRKILGSGSNAQYEVIGFVGFVPTSVTGGGSSATVHGYFTRVVWESLPSTSPSSPDFGVRAIELIE